MPSSSVPPTATPLPVQFTAFRKEDFASDSGVAFVNQQLSQIMTTLNAIVGAGGRTILPAGIDMQGSTVSGVGAPQGPTDAINSGHASANYGSEAQRSNLDVGGPQALKGLTSCYATLLPGQGINATITLAKITGGGSNGSITITNGVVSAFVQPT